MPTAFAKIRQWLNTHRFAGSVLQTYSARAAGIAAGLITSVVTARVLGPEGRGWLAAAAALATFCISLADCGLSQTNTYYAAKETKLRPVLLGNSLAFALAATVVTALALGIWAQLVPGSVYLPGLFFPAEVIYIFGLLASLLIRSILLSMGRIRLYNATDVWPKVAVLVAALLLAYWGVHTPGKYFGAMALAYLAGAVASLWACFNYLQRKIAFSWQCLRQCSGYSWRIYIITSLVMLIFSADVLIMQSLLGPALLGLYNVSFSVRAVLLVFPSVIQNLLLPRLTALAAAKQYEEIFTLTRKGALAAALVTLAFSILLVPLAKPFIACLFGEEFVGCVPSLLWMLPGTLFWAVAGVINMPQQAAGKLRLSIIGLALAVFCDIILNFFWQPRYGIIGAAYAFSIASLLLLLCYGTLNYYHYYHRELLFDEITSDK